MHLTTFYNSARNNTFKHLCTFNNISHKLCECKNLVNNKDFKLPNGKVLTKLELPIISSYSKFTFNTTRVFLLKYTFTLFFHTLTRLGDGDRTQLVKRVTIFRIELSSNPTYILFIPS